MSDWNHRCSEGCLAKYEHRTIYCDRTAPYTGLCDAHFTPEQKRACSPSTNTCRKGSWFTSEWSNCTGECFQMQRTRTVLCIMDGFVIDDAQCVASVKPAEAENCTKRDTEFCGPNWHYSEWSEVGRVFFLTKLSPFLKTPFLTSTNFDTDFEVLLWPSSSNGHFTLQQRLPTFLWTSLHCSPKTFLFIFFFKKYQSRIFS